MRNQSFDYSHTIKIQPSFKLTNTESIPTKVNEYITKGRKTLNPSSIHLQTPKKVNPSRSKRITLFKNSAKKALQEYELEFKKQNNNNQPNFETLSNLALNESPILFNNKDENYIYLVKKIAKVLKKRIKLPKCKIFKFYNSYRELILRIAKGIKKTAIKLNFWDKWENNITEKEINEIGKIASKSCQIIQQSKNKRSKRGIKTKNTKDSKNSKNINLNLSLFKKNKDKNELKINTDKYSENTKIINSLKNVDSSIQNNDFISQFSNFLKNNMIEICEDSKLPLIKNEKNYHLLSNIEFWIKYIIFISRNYKNKISIYNFVNFIQQFYLRVENINIKNEDFNKEIINQINYLFDENTISNFLLGNKIKKLEDLFSRYKNINNKYKYREIKIDEDCQCETCKNLYYEKIINYNKKNNKILYAKDNNLSYIIEDKNNSKDTGKKYYDKKIIDYFSSSKSKGEENKKGRSKNKYKKSESKKKNKKNKYDNESSDSDNQHKSSDEKNKMEKNNKRKKSKKK